MNKTKLLVGSVVTLMAFTLSGCGAIELTEEESDLIASYAASTLLNSSEDYQDRLVLNPSGSAVSVSEGATSVATPVPTQTPMGQTPDSSSTPVASATSTPSPTDNGKKEVSIDDLYHVSGARIQYKSYEFCKQFPKKASAYQILANEEEILFVVKFQVSNVSSKKIHINLMNRKIAYPMSVDGFEYKPTISVLENGGLNFLDTTLQAGKTQEAVLIYSLPRKIKNASQLILHIQEGKNQVTVSM